MEKRHNYVRKVAEVATQLFISNDKPNIAGLILAGSADFKTELSQSDMFDPVRTVVMLYVVFFCFPINCFLKNRTRLRKYKWLCLFFRDYNLRLSSW